MSTPSLKSPERTTAIGPDRLLATRYAQLLGWAKSLTRGDISKAEEIVQELFLYLALVRPDLSGIANLDGYLYISLRNLYRSTLARASREALHVVRVEDFDSFAFAVSPSYSGDLLGRQNDLRRICAFTVWRKQSSKTASYFILHFFHGYGRQEIADLAKLPISAIYNKLKTARAEVKLYLEEPAKLRIVSRDAAPIPEQSWSLLSALDLFRELRHTILQSRRDACLPEQELLAHYYAPVPISCSLLAHIASCERCLSVVDRHFRRPTLKDREPLDLFGFSSQSQGENFPPAEPKVDAMLQSVRRKWARIYEHRPRTLSIALNGQIIACHDVSSEHSRLSARIESSDEPQFVEVFSEQHVRLALLDVGLPPPDGAEGYVQRVPLSDQRWLELSLAHDGLGLQSAVAYFDPALAAVMAEEEPAVSFATVTAGRGSLRRFLDGLRALLPASAVAWAVMLCVLLGAFGYFAYRYSPTQNAAQILQDSIRLRNASLQGQTEHQVLHVEELSRSGEILQQRVVVLWRDGDGKRSIRRLFDAQHHFLAAEWRDRGGKVASRREAPGRSGASPINQFWDQDLSAQAFAAMDVGAPQLRSVEHGYELTRVGPTQEHPQLLSATLTLDHNLQSIRQTMRVRVGGEVHELRFERAEYERKPTGSVPDAIFNPENEQLSPVRRDRRSSAGRPHDLVGMTNAQLAELQIAVLYQLQAIHADTGVPIEVVRTAENRIRVSGTVDTPALKDAIDTRLRNLDGHEHLDLRIVSSREFVVSPGSKRSTPVEAYEVTQPGFAADMRIRGYFQAKGFSGSRLDTAVALFSRDALQHAQRSLQHAYALDRLGSSLSADELHAIPPIAQQEWTGMVNNHATGLENELRALHGQLAEIMLAGVAAESTHAEGMSIDEPAQFAIRASRLLGQVRRLNRQTGELFTSSGKSMNDTNLNASLQTIMDAIPLQQAEDVAAFAVRLNGETSASQTR